MKNWHVKPLTLALAGALLISQAVLAAAPVTAQSGLREEITSTPGRDITPADEALISASASKVMHHIGLAREAIHKKDGERAKLELRQAGALLDIIQATLPTAMVKDRIWTTDNKLQYENSEEVAPESVPISASLEARVDFDMVKLPHTKVQTKPQMKSQTKEKAAMEAEAEDAALYYEEVDLPLHATRHFVDGAQIALGKNRLEEADHVLRIAQDNVDTIEVFVPEPLLSARINLERAHAHFMAGQVADAKADVGRAIAQLNVASQEGDPAIKADVEQLRKDAQSLQARLDQNGPTLGVEMKSLWHHTKALADRAIEYSSFGWNKLRNHSPLRGDLIEAKRFVAYADIEANVAENPAKARADLEQAKAWLDKAAAEAKDKADAEVYVKDARAVVDTLIAGQAKMDTTELGNLKSQLGQAIGKL